MPPVYDAEEGEPNQEVLSARAVSPASARRYSFPYGPSTATSTRSDSIHEWYDAMEDGPEEFVMDETPGEHPGQQPSQLSQVATDAGSVVDSQEDHSSVDTDFEEAPDPDPSKEVASYRTHLPVPAPADEGSLFTILKKNVGKVSPASSSLAYSNLRTPRIYPP
jgi:oxysterol-binding protein-related protein 3/6/7